MTKLITLQLIEDASMWRGSVKKMTRPIVKERYGLSPPVGKFTKHQYQRHITNIVADLLNKGAYLRGGKDAKNRTDNMSHLALEEVCMTCFYTGTDSLVKHFPAQYGKEVMDQMIAMAGTLV